MAPTTIATAVTGVALTTGALSRRAWVRVTAFAAAALAGAGLALSLALAALGVSPLVIISGSMAPVYPVGTIVYSQNVPASSVAVGDVVTTDRFNGPGTVTHRVVRVEAAGDRVVLTLKGDANQGVDREPYEVTEVGIVRAAVPFAGLPQLWIQDLLGIDPLTA
ncbi:signal peptidase I [Microbacterium excoecariae]|uniref:signal peptidase I n=1 Tax=Microbacterium excoecariae TaxID=2715210 RepID=UPI00140A6B06|nr:signal peptidase I [Microbacterium excoecariae]NHI17010.1 signal peptidase I [Microbacterium excoecariae]